MDFLGMFMEFYNGVVFGKIIDFNFYILIFKMDGFIEVRDFR